MVKGASLGPPLPLLRFLPLLSFRGSSSGSVGGIVVGEVEWTADRTVWDVSGNGVAGGAPTGTMPGVLRDISAFV